ncbi:MAG: hypothetical protein CL624_09980 [Arcobacter sp.]|nr:hypothetical protein [Arcobacter sp.]|tara:strand:+ start:7312 stop:8226 length:915 start_codon:yes stop_codon:yes gene_type:complete
MIYFISNCTNSKKLTPSNDLLLKNYSFKNIDKSINEWEENKKKSINTKAIAKELYKGHSWQEILKSVNILSQLSKTKMLISSAGYGLIDSDKKIISYQVTFSKGSENSVHNFKNNSILNPTIKWWDKINTFDITTLEKDAYIFISVSYQYLIAMQNTIKQLIELYNKNVFIIVLSKDKLPENYNKNILRFDTRFNSFDKGTISSIIPRFSKWLFKEILENNLELNNQQLQKHIDNFLSKFSEYKIEERTNLSDEDILKVIIKQIKIKSITSKSRGLKDLRSEGYACSQERYGRIYTEIKGKHHG